MTYETSATPTETGGANRGLLPSSALPQVQIRTGEGLFSSINQVAGALAVAWRSPPASLPGWARRHCPTLWH